MDNRAVTPFLVERSKGQTERPRQVWEKIAGLLDAREVKLREMLFRYYCIHQSVPQIAAQMSQAEADLLRDLQSFHQDLRQALSEHPVTRVFLQPAAARNWEAFAGDCLSLALSEGRYKTLPADMEQQYTEMIQSHFGATFDLLCPLNWD
jgi:hypothetical protein